MNSIYFFFAWKVLLRWGLPRRRDDQGTIEPLKEVWPLHYSLVTEWSPYDINLMAQSRCWCHIRKFFGFNYALHCWLCHDRKQKNPQWPAFISIGWSGSVWKVATCSVVLFTQVFQEDNSRQTFVNEIHACQAASSLDARILLSSLLALFPVCISLPQIGWRLCYVVVVVSSKGKKY